MAKKEHKSLVDMIGVQELETDQLEKSVRYIHEHSPGQVEKKERTVRITVDTPETVHKMLKRIIIDEETDLKSFILKAVREKCEKLGHSV